VIDAAHELFLSDGYGATSIKNALVPLLQKPSNAAISATTTCSGRRSPTIKIAAA